MLSPIFRPSHAFETKSQRQDKSVTAFVGACSDSRRDPSELMPGAKVRLPVAVLAAACNHRDLTDLTDLSSFECTTSICRPLRRP